MTKEKEKERKKGGTWMYGVESTMVIDGGLFFNIVDPPPSPSL